jgi:hypothetical protein
VPSMSPCPWACMYASSSVLEPTALADPYETAGSCRALVPSRWPTAVRVIQLDQRSACLCAARLCYTRQAWPGGESEVVFSYFNGRTDTANDRCERWGPAATGVRIVADLNGWSPSAPHLGWTFVSALPPAYPKIPDRQSYSQNENRRHKTPAELPEMATYQRAPGEPLVNLK